MPTEIRSVDPVSVFRIAIPLGAMNGLVLALPIVWDWLQDGVWVTGHEMGPGTFGVGLLLVAGTSAITAAVLAALLAIVYNAVARRYGGVEVSLSR